MYYTHHVAGIIELMYETDILLLNIRWTTLSGDRNGLVCAFSTMPMTLNLYVHDQEALRAPNCHRLTKRNVSAASMHTSLSASYLTPSL